MHLQGGSAEYKYLSGFVIAEFITLSSSERTLLKVLVKVLVWVMISKSVRKCMPVGIYVST